MPDWRRCSVSHCPFSKQSISDGVRLYGLPKDPLQRSQWSAWISFQNGNECNFKNIFVCSNHFSEELQGNRKLKAGAVPSISLKDINNVGVAMEIDDLHGNDVGIAMDIEESQHLATGVAEPFVENNGHVIVENDFVDSMAVVEEIVVCDETAVQVEVNLPSIEDMDIVNDDILVQNNVGIPMEIDESHSLLNSYSSRWVPDIGASDKADTFVWNGGYIPVENDFVDTLIVPEEIVVCDGPAVQVVMNVPQRDVMNGDVEHVEGHSVIQTMEWVDDVLAVPSILDSVEANVRSQRVNRRCCVKDCVNNNTTHTLFALPRVLRISGQCHNFDNEWLKRCLQWIKFCGNHKVLTKDIACLHKHFYICLCHFESKHYNVINGRPNLHKNAIPSLHAPTPLPDDIIEAFSQSGRVPIEPVDDPDITNMHGNEFVWRGVLNDFRDLRSPKSKRVAKKFEEVMQSFEMKVCLHCNEKYMFYPGLKRAHRNHAGCWKFSGANNMDPGIVPDVLKDLTFTEEALIARVHPVLSVYKLKGLQYGYRGNVINFFQDVKEFVKELPHRIEDIPIVNVQFVNLRGKATDFRVRAAKVKAALLWLKENNEYYRDVEICAENLDLLPEDDDVFDRITNLLEDEDDGEECCDDSAIEDDSGNEDNQIDASAVPEASFINQNQQINKSLEWPKQSSDPVSEATPGLIVCAFPTLFPFGNCDLKDERTKKVQLHEYFKHFLAYHDDRFAKHKTFRFFAFNMWARHTALSSGSVFVNKDAQFSKMNVDQLKQHIEQNPNALKKLMYMGSNIRGSKAFWKSRSGELRDLVEQIGLPTIFLTMSAADLYWPDLFRLLSGKDISELRMSERRILLQDNPLIVDMFFQYRLQCFIDTVLEPEFQVVDYWFRIEYQHRGSPHVHGLFWLKDAPDASNIANASDEERKKISKYFDQLVSAVVPHQDCPMPDQHPCEVRFEDVNDVDVGLSQILKMVQKHTCSKSYCQRIDKKTRKTICRFHFPKEIRDHSEITVNPETGEVEFLPECNDEALNKFHPFIISTWRANIDIAPVLSKKAVVAYLTKYVTKCEVGSQSLKEICSSVCGALNGTETAKKAIQKILIKNCVERDISAQEVCHILMGSKLYSCKKRKFVIIYTKETCWVPLELNDKENYANDNSVGKSFFDKYKCRPENLANVSMYACAKYYNHASWKTVDKCNIVRVFPRLVLSDNEEKNEDYYRQQVMLHVPFFNVDELKEEGETWKNAYGRRGLVENEICCLNNITAESDTVEEVEDHDLILAQNEDWMIASRLNANTTPDTVELGRREADISHDWHANASKYEAFGDLNFFKNFIATEKAKDSDEYVRSDMPDVAFSEEQNAVKVFMEKQIEALHNKNVDGIYKRILVQGKAGTGKSLLIKYLIEMLCKEFGPSSFLLLGPTGVAARNIGGTTIHSALHLPRGGNEFLNLKGETSRKFTDKMDNVKFVIIDEWSMVGARTLALIDKRLREGTGINEPFGNLFVYIFGDYKQLPPVREDLLYGGPCRSLLSEHGRNMFNCFEKHFVLNQVYRQSDHMFLDILSRVSNGEVSQEDYKKLKKRFTCNVSRDEEKKFANALRLYATKKAVRQYNLDKLHKLVDENGNYVPIARIASKHHGSGASSGTVDDAGGLEPVLYLGVGTRIMLRSNLFVRRGLVNGSLGTVVDILYAQGKIPPEDAPDIIMVKFDGYTGPGIGADNLVPISAISQSWSRNGNSCTRQQFPIVLSYACTIHKSQGLTLDKAVIDIGTREFSLGLTYVGLSRVKCLEGILLQPVAYERFIAISKCADLVYRREFEQTVLSCRSEQ